MNPSQKRAYRALGLGPVWASREAEVVEPAPVRAGLAERAFAEPALAETAIGEPLVTEPVTAELVTAEFVDAEPAVAEPVTQADAGSAVVATPSARVGADIARLDWQPLAEMVESCRACGLCRTRRQTVFGVGPRTARWMIIGEAPGAEEDARGEPFVGQAGRLLDNMLASIGLSRERDVFITNVLKCRPPGNRNPEPGEVAECSPYLQRQLALVDPQVLLLMGRFAAQTILEVESSIAGLRGRVHQARVGDRTIPAVVTYHPAYLLRSLTEKAKSWQDLQLARRVMAGQAG